MSVKQISKFETTVGRRFDDEIKAVKHQSTVDLVAVVEKMVPSNIINSD